MSRPKEHGGGEAGPPIAGDPSSFPSDAELARTLLDQASRASLATLTEDGYPYASVISYAADGSGNPVLLVSEMAEHTVNAKLHSKSSLLVTLGTGQDQDPLSTSRLTVVGQLEQLDKPGDLREIYLEAHPYASYYADFTDFGFWRLNVERCRFIGGFGHMSWVSLESYQQAKPDPISDDAKGIVEHMNDDHAEANLLYAQKLAGLDTATEAAMVSVDTYGITLKVTTPTAPRMARLPFETPASSSEEVRSAVVSLLAKAREQD